MYQDFYKLTGKPFKLNPDPNFFYKSKGHQRAMAYLRYGIEQAQGFIVITGDVGTGKSTLVGMLFKELDKHDVVAAKIVSSNINEHDLLRLVAHSFGLPFERVTKASLLTRLEEFFKQTREEGKRALLVVDECQNLPNKSLEELRMLSNFEHEGEPLLQSFLLGQREFRATMRSKHFKQLRQRVTAAYHLRPLSERETRRYVEHRLTMVGWDDDPHISDNVFEEIFEFTRGVPRRINTLMDRLLLNTALDEEHAISRDRIIEVTNEIDFEYGDVDEDGNVYADEEPAEKPRKKVETVAEKSKDLTDMENRLNAMQNAMESMSRTMQATMAVQQQTTKQEDYPEPFSNKQTKPIWSSVFIGICVILAAGAAGAYYLLK